MNKPISPKDVEVPKVTTGALSGSRKVYSSPEGHGDVAVPFREIALTDGATDETKARYAFVFGDFRWLHRMGLIACYYRAAEWEHTDVMLAAHRLLLHLEKSRA